jgi:uncharacterized protein YqkB
LAAGKNRRPAQSAKTARRRPAFVDPGGDGFVFFMEVEVTNTASSGAVTRYMAAVDVPVVASQTNAQAIPIYLAPGQDTILVQEVGTLGDEGLQNASGYLLAQGSTAAPLGVTETSNLTPAITMQIAVVDLFAGTDLAGYGFQHLTYATNSFAATSDGSPHGYYPTLCVGDDANVYFLPGDYTSGTYNVFQENPGAVSSSSGGLPAIAVAATSPSASYLKPNTFNGYIASFDSNLDPIFVTATTTAIFSASLPTTNFAAGALLTALAPQTITAYADIEESSSYDCQNNYGY